MDIIGLGDFALITQIKKGWSTDCKFCVARSDGMRFLLRTSPASRLKSRQLLFEMAKQAAALGISMSFPVDVGRCDDGCYMLWSWVDGEDFESVLPSLSADKQYNLGIDAGKILRKIHSIPAPEATEDWSVYFNRKIDLNIERYRSCRLRFDGDSYMIDFADSNRHLLDSRPQCFQHGDYHIGNMMLEHGKLVIIDFDRSGFGDPWEEFNRTVWCAPKSPSFTTGMVNGYFDGTPPALFWELLALYIASNTIAALPWAIPFGPDEVEVMRRQSQDVLRWYDNMQHPVPTWYMDKPTLINDHL